MAKKEVNTDLWVASQLKECGISYDAQGSNVKELDETLKTASKRGTGKAGYPEYVSVVDDYVIVIEDKADLDKQEKLTKEGIIDVDVKAVTDYAVNGAYFYAKHIAQNSSFKKVFAVGVSGNEKHHEITPLYVDDREGYKELPNLESFVSFSPSNIREYYTRYVLEEETDVEKTTEQILKDAAELHEYLRTYGTLKDQDKPLVVAGILLALDEIEHVGFSVNSLTGDQTPGMRDGDKLMNAIKGRLTRSNVGPEAAVRVLHHPDKLPFEREERYARKDTAQVLYGVLVREGVQEHQIPEDERGLHRSFLWRVHELFRWRRSDARNHPDASSYH